MAGSTEDVQKITEFTPEYTDITPRALTAASPLIIPVPPTGQRNVPVELVFQNRDTVTRNISLRAGDTEFLNLDIKAGEAASIAWTGALERKLAAEKALKAVPAADNVIWLATGRYYTKA